MILSYPVCESVMHSLICLCFIKNILVTVQEEKWSGVECLVTVPEWNELSKFEEHVSCPNSLCLIQQYLKSNNHDLCPDKMWRKLKDFHLFLMYMYI